MFILKFIGKSRKTGKPVVTLYFGHCPSDEFYVTPFFSNATLFTTKNRALLALNKNLAFFKGYFDGSDGFDYSYEVDEVSLIKLEGAEL